MKLAMDDGWKVFEEESCSKLTDREMRFARLAYHFGALFVLQMLPKVTRGMPLEMIEETVAKVMSDCRAVMTGGGRKS